MRDVPLKAEIKIAVKAVLFIPPMKKDLFLVFI